MPEHSLLNVLCYNFFSEIGQLSSNLSKTSLKQMLLYHLEHSGGNFLEFLETFRVVNLSLSKFNSEVLTPKIKSK